MKDKIVPFPSATVANPRVERITVYRPTTRAETLIVVWLCGWALLTAAECVHQVSKTPAPAAQPAQPAPAQTYVAAMYPIDSGAPGASPSPRETCNFSHTDRVLWLN
jgi:hypothetical protein